MLLIIMSILHQVPITYVPGTGLRDFQLMLATTLCGSLHFVDEHTEAQSGKASYPRSHSLEIVKLTGSRVGLTFNLGRRELS